MPDTQYARCGDLSLAYQVFGSGSVDVVVSGSFVTNLEVFWGSPEYKAFFDRLGTFARVAIFDKAGVGLSDPVPKWRTIEERAEEIEAVMDAAGFDRAALFGISEGGPASLLLAATRPDRVSALVLIGTFATTPTMPESASSWAEGVDLPPAELLELAAGAVPPEYMPTEAQVGRLQGLARAVRDSWGTGEALSYFVPSLGSSRRLQLGMFERVSASPGMARATMAALAGLDIQSVLPAIRVPTLVIHATDDIIPVQSGRMLADRIPHARLLEVPGRDHPPWFYESDVTPAIEEFLTGAQPHAQTQRALRTILFTDIVGSTDRAAAMGDERWHALLDRYDELTRENVALFDGRVVKSTGDGHLITLDGPAQAVRCAQAIRAAVDALGVELRLGVHTGECELMGDDVGGIGVHIAARVMAQADPGEILVSSTVRDLVVGSGIGFDDCGVHTLKGVPGDWRLLAVQAGAASPTSPEGWLAAHPTPPVAEGMRRSDHAMAAVARRAPGLLRGIARWTDKRPAAPRAAIRGRP